MTPTDLSDQELADLALAKHALQVLDAREDSAAFVAGLFGYELAPFQVEWHRALQTADEAVIFAAVEHGKTQELSIGFPIWKLGREPHTTGLLIGNTATQAEKLLAAIRQLIEQAPFVREVFPNLRPMPGKYAKWTDQGIRIAGAPVGQKDLSLATAGVFGPILGSRLSFVIMDDVLDFENTRTLAQRRKVIEWFDAVLLGRLVAGAQIAIVGNAWFPDDLMHALEKRGFKTVRHSAYEVDGTGNILPESILWPQQWPLPRLAKRVKAMGSVEADRQFRCKPYASGRGHFKLEWFDKCFEAGEQWNGGIGASFELTYKGPWPTFCGVDLGVHEKESSDETAFFVVAVDPDRGLRRPIWVECDRLEGPRILERLFEIYQRYGCVFMVENVAAQAYLEQFAREKGLPIRGFTTGKQKADPRFGIPSLSVELEAGQWILPNHPEMYAWRSECLAYKPGDHTGDRLMASWFAREAARAGDISEGATVEPEASSGVSYGRTRARYEIGRRGPRGRSGRLTH
jgi:hypothetical protein